MFGGGECGGRSAVATPRATEPGSAASGGAQRLLLLQESRGRPQQQQHWSQQLAPRCAAEFERPAFSPKRHRRRAWSLAMSDGADKEAAAKRRPAAPLSSLRVLGRGATLHEQTPIVLLAVMAHTLDAATYERLKRLSVLHRGVDGCGAAARGGSDGRARRASSRSAQSEGAAPRRGADACEGVEERSAAVAPRPRRAAAKKTSCPKGRKTAVSAAAKGKTGTKKGRKSKSWTCSQCTFVNAAATPSCEMCGTKRGSHEETPIIENAMYGLEAHELEDLMTRELTPEDYETLMRLAESVEVKTGGENAIDSLRHAPSRGEECGICLFAIDKADVAHHLPDCEHAFHAECVSRWLSDYGKGCPICEKVGGGIASVTGSGLSNSLLCKEVSPAPRGGDSGCGDNGCGGERAEHSAGERVEADFNGEGRYYPGKVAQVNADGTCNILYDDGDRESSVPSSRIRSKKEEVEGSAPKGSAPKPSVGGIVDEATSASETRSLAEPLPFGGDINAAMRAQDRKAIREIMAARRRESE